MNFIKSYNYKNLQIKLLLLFLLNGLDIIFTLLLLRTELFMEANIFMINIINSPLLALIIKLGLVGLLIFIEYKRIVYAKDRDLFFSNILITGIICLYILINLSHIFWCFYALKILI